ncbi:MULTISPECIES: flagellar hook-associated protein 2 [Bacillus amyloliquefaciens group]|jgi:flagellar hook-associated protein 2|uniref:flagellar hook-associated protein 2 n=1 Tax=Bacillus amyloliquefaciens group TaxID=1938374 RepID=UPI001580218B|nr:flagellar hook-associated protein 2 [Bacillus amyloliquefaciens]NUI21251.1 flagellar hook-associated protein 2 [Bacillus amyloliquefaciens]NUI30384.1 flagellar hook-associated protein 2 [Bacillus amyloliquefaciens]NUI33944.1 flagellar hook-associated protein 2 [Bacillus amyloliquefaciens]NUI67937.1 flagellar hook-associated protein 2 [Bacillus amyloliquefaciens]NUI71500.1 flagellar hook-associated protein 2 [Bacillus amyloliquefaciens]
MVTRITGLNSGLDVDSLVKKMMDAEKQPLNKLNQQKQTLEWKRDAYREVNTQIADMYSTTFNNMLMSTNWNKKTVTSSDSSVSAAAVSAEQNISTSMSVQQLATPTTYKSSGAINFTSGQSQTLKFNVTNPGETKPTEVNVTIAATDTIDDVISKLNSSGLGVTALKEKISNGTDYVDTIAFTSNKTGEGFTLAAGDDATKSFLKDQLGFAVDDATNELTANAEGKNAKFTFNGLEMTKTSNNFTINGIKYTLNSVTDSNKTVTINSTTDTDGIFDNIKDFVDKYNTLIKSANEKVTESKYRDYKPLTDEQREAMTDKQIEQWEAKAKSGLLRSDSTLQNGLAEMRLDLYSTVTIDGKKYQLADFGIETSSYEDQGKFGKLVIKDEAKLKQKITENPSLVAKLFNADSTSTITDSSTGKTIKNPEEQGIARRLKDTLNKMQTQISKQAGTESSVSSSFAIGKSLNEIETNISNMKTKLDDIESRYYKKFSALDTALEKLNSQSSYLTSMLGSSTS